MKKIAVAQMNGSDISKHFGRSRYFGIYTISEDRIEGPDMINNTFTHHARRSVNEKVDHHNHSDHHHNHDHKSVVEGLQDCQVLIAGGMGMGAINSLSDAGIEVIITDNFNARDAVYQYSKGILKNLNTSCNK
jgi:predicted Fe-Mo cluster-binding NifX family protein